jgi:glutathione synthase/RimK-type ligase-like ATP-grasp enzyme
MKILLVVQNAKKWPLQIAGVEVVSARKYITEPVFSRLSGVRAFNLTRVQRYQSIGYYVSLLAEARGHKPVPSITILRDLQTPAMVRAASAEIEERLEKDLAQIKGDHFTLSIYFGRNVAKRYDRLCKELFNLFHAPLLRAEFSRGRTGWQLQNINTISITEIPESHHGFVQQVAEQYLSTAGYRSRRRQEYRYAMAILHKENDPMGPSSERALNRFIRAGQKVGIDVELITKEDFGRLREFDALFIRETTSVNDHTFRFARLAEAEGLVVIDDPQSIIKCANKVYLAEMMAHQHVSTPHTMIVHKDNVDLIVHELGLPCVLKQPDSSFSAGVKKVATKEELEREAQAMLDRSELIIAQEFVPTEFDWRVGVLEGRALYVCRYYMARKHWQIVHHKATGRREMGRFDTLALAEAPPEVVKLALRSTDPIGNGLYGVDIKQVNGRFCVMEVNDNPNIDAGVEDKILKDELYDVIMRTFLKRIEAKKSPSRKEAPAHERAERATTA